MIERHEGRQQILCDSCPASYPNTYADEDFAVMVADVKTAGWAIRPAPLDAATADLFAAPATPRIAGKSKPQRFTHTCPSCVAASQASEHRRLL